MRALGRDYADDESIPEALQTAWKTLDNCTAVVLDKWKRENPEQAVKAAVYVERIRALTRGVKDAQVATGENASDNVSSKNS